MDWVDKLERRFGHLAIPQLVNGLLVGQIYESFTPVFISFP